MIISSNVTGSGLVPPHPPGGRLLAAIDVEWSKNYRICGGNVPFCYSVVWLALSDDDAGLEATRFWYTSAYVQDASEGADLTAGADAELACQQAGITTGPGPDGADGRQAVKVAVERALMIALVCARHLSRYEWAGTLRIEPVLAAATWDCLPQPAADTPAVLTCQVAAASGTHAGAPSSGNPR